MWVFNSPNGPSLKFQVNDIHTLHEPKMNGNCIKYARSILNFDNSFSQQKNAHLMLIKEMLTQCFNIPKHHPKSKPFFDHIVSFLNIEDNIFFRNYQILNDVKGQFCNSDDAEKLQLSEIGPRFNLKLIKIFNGVLGGRCIYTNPNYVNPGEIIKRNAMKFKDRQLKLEKEEEELVAKTRNIEDVETKWINKLY